jgi:hypothetical protein
MLYKEYGEAKGKRITIQAEDVGALTKRSSVQRVGSSIRLAGKVIDYDIYIV